MSAPAPVTLGDQMAALRGRADEDFANPHAVTERGRHTEEVADLGLRVSLTRSRYPNRADGQDLYAITISRLALDHAPAEPEVAAVLEAAFGDVTGRIAQRSGGGLVKMFRVAAG